MFRTRSQRSTPTACNFTPTSTAESWGPPPSPPCCSPVRPLAATTPTLAWIPKRPSILIQAQVLVCPVTPAMRPRPPPDPPPAPNRSTGPARTAFAEPNLLNRIGTEPHWLCRPSRCGVAQSRRSPPLGTANPRQSEQPPCGGGCSLSLTSTHRWLPEGRHERAGAAPVG